MHLCGGWKRAPHFKRRCADARTMGRPDMVVSTESNEWEARTSLPFLRASIVFSVVHAPYTRLSVSPVIAASSTSFGKRNVLVREEMGKWRSHTSPIKRTPSPATRAPSLYLRTTSRLLRASLRGIIAQTGAQWPLWWRPTVLRTFFFFSFMCADPSQI